MVKCEAAFRASDANGDGFLTAEEFAAFDAALTAESVAKGNWASRDPQLVTDTFNALNMVAPEETAGVSFTAW